MDSGKIARALAHKTTRAVVPKTHSGRFHNLLFALALFPLFVLTWFTPRHALVAAHEAAARGDVERLERLYQEDPLNLLRQDVGGASSLHYAALNHQRSAARFLLSHGVEVDCRNLQGQSPLFYAVSSNDDRMVELLVAAGADPNLVDEHGLTPVYLAVVRGFPSMVERLGTYGVNTEVEHDVGRRPLHEAVLRAKPELVRLLLGLGADRTARDREGETPLELAQKHHLAEIERLLRESPTVGAGTVRSKRN